MANAIVHKTHGKHARSPFRSFLNAMKRDWKTILFYVLLTAVYFSRAFFLESDLPPWGVVAYQPVDEGTYANLALNWVNFGSIDPNDYYAGQYEFLMQPHAICDVVGNLFVGLSLFCFGDNYFGLRMGVVFAGYLVLILFCLTIGELRKAYGAEEQSAPVMALLMVLALLTSFIFFNATKAVEPSIFRLLLIQLVIFCLVKAKMSIKLRGFLVGFFVFVSIFLVYVTNLFIGIPVLAYAVFVFATQGKRSGLLFVLFGIIGAVLAWSLAAIYYWHYWDTAPITNAVNSVLIFESTGQAGNAYAVGAANSLRNVRAFFASNAMLYALPLVGIILVCALPLIKRAFKATGGPLLALVATVIGFFAQTIISDDFVVRKAIVIFPALLLLFYCGYLWALKQCGVQPRIGKRVVVFVAFLFAVAVMVYVTYFRLFRANSPTFSKLDYSEFDIVLLLLNCALSIIVAAVFLFGVMMDHRKTVVASAFGAILICITVNLCLVFNYNIINQTYTEKEAMIELGEVANGKVIAGEYENGFTLYNDILPLLNDSQTLTSYIRENPELLYFDYSNARSFSSDPKSLYRQIEEIAQFERAYQTFGKKRSMSLYELEEQ